MSRAVHYHCQRCTACCRWPGFVKVTEAEIGMIARHVRMEEHDFIQQFTRLRPNRDGLALIDKPNGECHFLDGDDCTLQAVKPEQCRDFPNRWNFPGWREICEAIPELRPASH
jgi:Fe-S-cluster containining protein